MWPENSFRSLNPNPGFRARRSVDFGSYGLPEPPNLASGIILNPEIVILRARFENPRAPDLSTSRYASSTLSLCILLVSLFKELNMGKAAPLLLKGIGNLDYSFWILQLQKACSRLTFLCRGLFASAIAC